MLDLSTIETIRPRIVPASADRHENHKSLVASPDGALLWLFDDLLVGAEFTDRGHRLVTYGPEGRMIETLAVGADGARRSPGAGRPP